MSWSVSEAKAKLSELLNRARRHPQVIENRGEQVAVVLSVSEYERRQAARVVSRPTPLARLVELAEQLKAEGDLSIELPKRKVDRARPSPFGDG